MKQEDIRINWSIRKLKIIYPWSLSSISFRSCAHHLYLSPETWWPSEFSKSSLLPSIDAYVFHHIPFFLFFYHLCAHEPIIYIFIPNYSDKFQAHISSGFWKCLLEHPLRNMKLSCNLPSLYTFTQSAFLCRFSLLLFSFKPETILDAYPPSLFSILLQTHDDFSFHMIIKLSISLLS